MNTASITARLRQYLITGLLVWLPMGVTVWFLLCPVGILDGIFFGMLTAAETVLPTLAPLASKLHRIPDIGVILVVIVLLSTGVFMANMFGQWVLSQWDRLITRIPVVRNIYSCIKQVFDTVFTGAGQAFSKAILVQYPRHGSWTIGFLTSHPVEEVACFLPGEHCSVYVPTTPNFTSGFFPHHASSRCHRVGYECG